jgi:hypothetical protein
MSLTCSSYEPEGAFSAELEAAFSSSGLEGASSSTIGEYLTIEP